MRKEEAAERLLDWFDTHRREMPWREHLALRTFQVIPHSVYPAGIEEEPGHDQMRERLGHQRGVGKAGEVEARGRRLALDGAGRQRKCPKRLKAAPAYNPLGEKIN